MKKYFNFIFYLLVVAIIVTAVNLGVGLYAMSKTNELFPYIITIILCFLCLIVIIIMYVVSLKVKSNEKNEVNNE